MPTRAVTPSGAPQPPPPPPPSTGGRRVTAAMQQAGAAAPGAAPGAPGGATADASGRGRSSGQIGEQGFKADVSVGGDMDKMIKDNLMARVQGKSPKFSEEILGHMKQKLFKETQGQTRRARMSLMADAARRGVFRSEATGALIRDAEIAGIQAYSSGVKDLMIQKAMTDHEDMIKAIESSQQWLANTRQYQLGVEQNEISRQGIRAQLAAAAMSAAASRYSADRGLEGARASASASRWATQQRMLDSRAVARDSQGNVTYLKGPDGQTLSIQQQTFLDAPPGSDVG